MTVSYRSAVVCEAAETGQDQPLLHFTDNSERVLSQVIDNARVTRRKAARIHCTVAHSPHFGYEHMHYVSFSLLFSLLQSEFLSNTQIKLYNSRFSL